MFWRRCLLSRSPNSKRQLRFVAIVIIFFVIFFFLPGYSSYQDINTTRPGVNSSSFRIQTTFQPESSAVRRIRLDRQQQVRKAFLHAWKGYKEFAWLHDEILPLSGGAKDPYVGWAATLVDSLDALYILGLHDEFHQALKALDMIDFTKPHSERVPVFETTIRYLGGLLGAYDISDGKYPILLEKADELGDFLFRAFNTTNGIPVPYYWWQKVDEVLVGESGVLVAQIGSLTLEFTRLAQLTGKRKYFDGISKIMDHIDKAQNGTQIPGLWPSQVDTVGPSFGGSQFTLGAWADSLYEYLPKQHLLLDGKTNQYLKMYQFALESANKHHFFRAKTPGNQDILFTGDLSAYRDGISLRSDVQHLGCFVGGMVGLGARINKSPSELRTAIRLTDSCVWAYQNTITGIMPEIFSVEPCPAEGSCKWTAEDASSTSGHDQGFTAVRDSSYQLRPEAIESVFIMYRITGDPVWQEKGWNMFRAIMNYTTTPIANARINDVTSENVRQADSMESFWLAETLKYFFLLFSEPDVVSLDDFVLNTEAHPFRQRDNLFAL
ncbi:glycoside hydrolase family 47 protein [Amylocarpus encephaloides]|uniref:alpha-1,2-Mannosidase n=1 Tax=Amylocarpus encephaloides TaxID=45428 RepID=A0A9P7YJN6_9HELO|nr:glycoside hydrolase family 47 protein [Amylocarpus encephaloides]